MAEDAEIVEAADEEFANAVWDALKGDHNCLRKQAIIVRAHREALSAARPLIERAARKEALEEAARVAEQEAENWPCLNSYSEGARYATKHIAQAIRALDEGGGDG